MEIKEALTIYEELSNSKHKGWFKALTEKAVNYAQIRVEWYLCRSSIQFSLIASERTHAHDDFIDTCDMLSLKMKESGEDVSWRLAIGTDRKSIGDFACLIHAVIGIKSR